MGAHYAYLILRSSWIDPNDFGVDQHFFLLGFMHKHLDFLERCLSGNKCVINTKSLWGGGVIGRLMRLGMVFIVISMPGFMYARGEAMKDAHQSIPRHLKRWMWGLHISLFLNLTSLMALSFLIKFF